MHIIIILVYDYFGKLSLLFLSDGFQKISVCKQTFQMIRTLLIPKIKQWECQNTAFCCSLPYLLTRSLIPCRIFSRCSSIFLCLTRRSCSPCLIASCLNFSCSAAFSLSSGVVSSPPTEGIWPRIRN